MQVQVTPGRRLPPELVEAAHTHAAFALTRFSRAIGSVTIRFDAPPKHGGGDRLCTVTVHLLRPAEDIVVTHADVDDTVALSRTILRAARAVARRLDRRRASRLTGAGITAAGGQSERRNH